MVIVYEEQLIVKIDYKVGDSIGLLKDKNMKDNLRMVNTMVWEVIFVFFLMYSFLLANRSKTFWRI
jgi:hypothetical protein